jgi:dihydroflavonol-4-reductase
MLCSLTWGRIDFVGRSALRPFLSVASNAMLVYHNFAGKATRCLKSEGGWDGNLISQTDLYRYRAGGHLGGQVVLRLLSDGRLVRVFLLPGEKCPAAEDPTAAGLISVVRGNVCKPETLEGLFTDGEGAEYIVIHCAGLVSIATRKDDHVYAVNVGGTANIISACLKHGVKRLVYVSSVHALPELPHGRLQAEVGSFDPRILTGEYARTKAIASQLVLDAAKKGLDAVIVHPAGIIGPGGLPSGNMTNLVSVFLRGRLPAAVKGGFDFVDVRDVAAGIAAPRPTGESQAHVIFLAAALSRCASFSNTLSEVSGRRKVRLFLPIGLARAFAPLQEAYCHLLRKPLLFTGYSLYTLSQNSLYSSEKARRELGYSTRELRETLRDTVNWARAHLPVKTRRRAFSR